MCEIKELKIKGMVCPRCISTVRQELENLGIKIVDIELGRVIINCTKTKIKIQDIELVLKRNGFELLTTNETKTIEAIKLILIGIIDNTPIVLKVNLSEKLETSLNRDYTYLSKLFSKVSGITIEKYFIQLKIEKSK